MVKGSAGLPVWIINIIESGEGIWTGHALDSADELGLTWDDVIEVQRTSGNIKKERDREAVNGFKYAMVGRDRAGRMIYMAGKVVTFESTRYWKVISIHESD